MKKSEYSIIVLLLLVLAAIVIDINHRIDSKPVSKPFYYNYNIDTPKSNKSGSNTIKIGRSHSGNYVPGSDVIGLPNLK